MAEAVASSVGASPPLPYGRWALLAGVLLAELLTLTLRFDAGGLEPEQGWWRDLLLHSHLVPQWALAVAAAVLVFAGARLHAALRGLTVQVRQCPSWRVYGLVHLLVFAAFYGTTAAVLGSHAPARGAPEAWTILWIALALAVLATWLAALLPPGLWLSLVRQTAGGLLAGGVVGSLAWVASQLAVSLGQPLRQATLEMAHVLLRGLTPEVIYQPTRAVLGTPTFLVEIAPQCSGSEGVGLIVAFLGGYLWFCRRRLRLPAALLLLPLGAVLMALLNVVRITLLILIGSWGSPEVALGGFHSQAGWLAFIAVTLGLVRLGSRSPWFSAVPVPPVERKYRDATPAYVAPLVGVTAVAMLTEAVSDGLDLLYPVRVAAALALLAWFRPRYRPLRWTWSWHAVALGTVGWIIWLLLVPESTNGSGAALGEVLARWPRWAAGGWLLVRVLGAVVTVPVIEELAFRGFLLRRLVAADFRTVTPRRFTWPAVLISSALFGALHTQWAAGMLVGLLYALAYYRRGRLLDAVLAHATTNALLAVNVLATGAWGLW